MTTFMPTFDLNNYFDFEKINNDEYIKLQNLSVIRKNDYAILKYNNKQFLSGGLENFRSVILYKGRIVSFAPPKSVSLINMQKYPTIKNMTMEEYVEGTMMNVFYNGTDWEMATRSVIGGYGKFYNTTSIKNFRTMFMEAMNTSTLEFDNLNKLYCYSFVFQHPDNRIVVKTTTPKLYLCAVYKIEGTIVEEINFRSDGTLCSIVNVPKIYSNKFRPKFESWSDVTDKFANKETTSYDIMGVVIKHGGMRTKIRNPNYEFVRQLRGNQPKLQFQYYNLRRMGKVRDFLKFYPEYKREFSSFRTQIHTYTKNLHQYYLQCYVKKEKPLKEFPYEYRSHMYALHQIYLNELRIDKKFISLSKVIYYINNLASAQLMFTINYKLRRQYVTETEKEFNTIEQPST
jgi:hypothetical protein